MATDNPFGNLFGKSPIGPIQEHMTISDRAAQYLPELMEATAAEEWDRAAEIYRAIQEAEDTADTLKLSVGADPPSSLFLPVPRTDLLELVAAQDVIANTAKDIAGLVLGRRMRFPKGIRRQMKDYIKACVAVSSQALAAIQELDELLEVGFVGREVALVERMLKELDKKEQRTDRQAAKLREKLFDLEEDLPPIDVMFYYRVIELANFCRPLKLDCSITPGTSGMSMPAFSARSRKRRKCSGSKKNCHPSMLFSITE